MQIEPCFKKPAQDTPLNNDNQDIFLSSLARQRNKIAFSLSGPMRCESLHALVLLRYDCIRAQ
ncbi:hypothetical protein ALP58_102725 [Pseudomonas savastanoi]|uniref:Uncharacterized protein n=2 Tax=Pseudomonas syringae group TaxID=136849 RepID=A0A0P9N8S1_PSESX|nr:hypothetical protein ALO79_100819 [Pseudomonas syringae pv. castaneae]RMS89942.1 hypothetical protein ALP58_102725 [Pseudomonas savastanoi]